MSQKTISLRFNGNTYRLVSDIAGLFNLNDLHRASGGLEKDKPTRWKRTQQASDLIEEISQRPNMVLAVVTRRGGNNPGTWAVEPLLFAYAEWISSEFHAVVIEAFTALANNDVKKAKEIVRTAVRVEGIPVRKEVASKIMKYGDKTFIGDMTDAVNLYVTGKTAKGIRATRTEGFNKSTPTRDRMTDNELKAVTAIEALVALQIERDENKPDWMGRSSVRELVNNTGNTVRSMIQ
ncbi:KilA-N domain-containing protein [Klebsiella aerogenes]|uniref:KilA-N domain-containing protein n=1 Tax=Klebsiella aerogenes TaxID=548 RepID=UPI00378A6DFC